MQKITVLLADDHTIVRRGLRSLLQTENDMEVVAEAETGRQAVQLATALKPDVVLMDIAMPELNGLEAVRQLTKEFPGVHCIMLSMHADEEHVWQDLQAGATGYVVKGAPLAELELAINSVAKGETYLSPGVSKPVISEYIRRTSDYGVSPDSLTPRQREILQMIGEGKNTKQIALALEISVKTVESHRAQLIKRLGVRDIASLVRHALRLGIVTLDGMS